MKDTFVRQLTIGAILAVFLTAAIVISLWNSLPPQLPWLYSLPWGEGMLISKLWWDLSLLAPLAVCLLDYLVADRWMGKDLVVARTIVGSGVTAVALYLLSFWRVLLIFR